MVNYTLQSADALLTLAGNRLYDLKTARPYNPASGAFNGAEYTLSAPDGTVYHLSTARGVIAHIPHFNLKHKKITGKRKAKNQDD